MTAARYRGQPLVALILVVGGWVTARAIAWDTMPRAQVAPAAAIVAAPQAAFAGLGPVGHQGANPGPPDPQGAIPGAIAPLWREAPVYRAGPRPVPSYPRPRPIAPSAPYAPTVASGADGVPPHVAAAHQLLWMAALADLQMPPGLAVRPAARLAAASPSASRWSADGWLLLRRGGTIGPGSGLAPSTYGASQAGAVVRYRLAPASGHRPALHLRGSAALNGSREREAAFGVSARPVAGLPVVLAAEARVNTQPGGTRLRPAAFAYTELAPVPLGRTLRAEAYGQAGYVGGSFASLFADGQLRVDASLARVGRGELRAGAGTWGGAQKGASRLDLGPTATIGLPLGRRVAARLGFDWRFRLAGDAEPDSGPALTLSAGF